MSTQLISGSVSELHIRAGSYNLSLRQHEDKFAAGTDVEMESFVCKVSGYTIHGMFHKVGFADGDIIDFAVDEDDERRLTALAARNQATRNIWVQPYKTRGNAAQLRHDLFWSAVISFGCGFAAWAFFLNQFKSANAMMLSSWIGGLLLGILVVINYLVRKRFYPLSSQATTVFQVLGFSNPANVDLPKGLSKAEAQWAHKHGGTVTRHGPWQFRY